MASSQTGKPQKIEFTSTQLEQIAERLVNDRDTHSPDWPVRKIPAQEARTAREGWLSLADSTEAATTRSGERLESSTHAASE